MIPAKGLCVLVLALLSAGRVHSESTVSPFSPDRVLQVYLQRADHRLTSDHWFETASGGLTAMSGWEQRHARETVVRRHAMWVLGGFPPADVAGLAAHLDRTNRQYSYLIDHGSIVRDSAGDPIVLNREGLEADLARYSEAVTSVVETWYREWHNNAEARVEEAIARTDPDYRDETRVQLRELLNLQSQQVARERDRLVNEARHRLFSVRLKDTWSLRRKSEEEAAGSTVERLVRDTVVELERTAEPVGFRAQDYPFQMLLHGDQWEQEFRIQFERGLTEWNRAEQGLLEQRIEWEYSQRNSYIEGERTWDRAFADLAEARVLWMSGMIERFEQGRAEWTASVEEFARSVHTSMNDLLDSVRADLGLHDGRLRELLQVYDQAAALLNRAQMNLDFLEHERHRLSYDGAIAVAGIDYLDEQIALWQETSRRAAEQMLAVESDVRDARYRNVPGLSVQETDPAAREIARLEALLEMTDHRVAVATAVAAYATDSTSARATEARTLGDYISARDVLDEAERQYQIHLDRLDQHIETMDRSYSMLFGVAGEMEELQREADAARHRYEQRWEVWFAGDPQTIERAIEVMEREVRLYRTTERFDRMVRLLRASEAAERNSVLETAATIRNALTEPDGAGFTPIERSALHLAAVTELRTVEASSIGPVEFSLWLLTKGLDITEPGVDRLLSAQENAHAASDDESARLPLSEAVDSLVEQYAGEHTRLVLALALLDAPALDALPTGDELLTLPGMDSLSETEETILLELIAELFDVVPAWILPARAAASLQIETLLRTLVESGDPGVIVTADLSDLLADLSWLIEFSLAGADFDSLVDLLDEVHATMNSGLWDRHVTRRTVEQERMELQARDRDMLLREQRVLSMRQDLENWHSDRGLFFDREVAPAEQEFQAADDRLSVARVAYRTRLDEIERLIEAVQESSVDMAEHRANTLTARREYALAEELHDYARNGYPLLAGDPSVVLEQRVAERNRISSLLGFLRDAVAGTESDAEQRLDEQYRLLLARRTELLNAHDYLHYLSGVMADDHRAIQRAVPISIEHLDRAVQKLFVFPSGFVFEPDPLGQAGLDLGLYAPISEWNVDPFAIDNPEVARQRSNDIVAWLSGMRQVGADGLRDFALGYHHDFAAGAFAGTSATEILHGAGVDQNFRGLLDHGEVRANVPEALRAAGRDARARIEADDHLRRHYRFFVSIIASTEIDFDPVGILAFVEKDLARVAVAHVEQKAQAAERRLRSSTGWIKRNVFGHKPWRPVQRRREQMAKFSDGGQREREAIVAVGMVAAETLRTLRVVVESSAFGDGRSDAATSLAAWMNGLPVQPGPDAFEVIQSRIALSGLTTDPTTVLSVAGESISGLIGQNHAQIMERAGVLTAGQNRQMEEYLAAFAGGADSSLESMLPHLFTQSSFNAEDRWHLEFGSADSMTRSSAVGRRVSLEMMMDALRGSHETALTGWMTMQAQQLAVDRAELLRRKENWEARMVELSQVAAGHWLAAEQRLSVNRGTWREQFQAGHRSGSHEWQRVTREFDSSRRQWISEAASSAVVSGGNAADLLAELERSVLPLMNRLSATPETGYDARFGQTIDELMRRVESMGSAAGRTAHAIAPRLPQSRTDLTSARRAADAADLITETVHRSTATIGALQMRRQLEETRGRIDGAIEGANRGTAKRFADMLEAAGFTASGREYRRRVVVNRSLFGGEKRETQTIESYRSFVRPDFDPGVDLSEHGLSRLSSEMIEAMVGQAIERLNAYMGLIFGSTAELSGTPVDRLSAAFVREFDRALLEFEQSARFNEHREMSGLFLFHVGYAPVMKDRDPAGVRLAGFGETGRIMLGFMKYEASQARGMMMLETAAWDIPLWDASGSPFEAPSIRSVATVGVSIAATLVGQPWVALALTAANQAAFASMDTAVAGHSASATWVQAGKNVLASTASTLTGAVFTGFGEYGTGFFEHGLSGVPVGGATMGSGWLGGASVAAGQHFTSSVAQSAIQATHFGGGWKNPVFDSHGFRREAFGAGSVHGYGAVAIGGGVTSGLQSNWKLDKKAFAHLDIRGDYQTDALSRFLGGAASEATLFALDGRATVNLLNIADVFPLGGDGWGSDGGVKPGHGLIELDLGRSGPGNMRIGGGGLDVSASRAGAVSASVDELFLMKRVQNDINNAMIVRSNLLGVSDRALFRSESDFTGVSPEVFHLAEELEKVRSRKSRDNVDGLFMDREKREHYGEGFIDDQLGLAFAQRDISPSDFMFAEHFDTTGSFEIAHRLYENSEASLIAMFAGGKAYAGAERAGSPTYDRRLALFLDYFDREVSASDAAVRVNSVFGDSLIGDPLGPGATPRLDSTGFIREALGDNRAGSVPGVLSVAGRLPELFQDVLQEGANRFSVDRFIAAVGVADAAGLIGNDPVYRVLESGDYLARAEASGYVNDNRYAFLSAYRVHGGQSPEAVFTNYVLDGSSHFQVEVGYREGRFREVARSEISAFEYDRAVQPFVSPELTQYRGMDTFCNLNTNEYSIAYGGPNLQYDRGVERTANMIHELLVQGAANQNGRFVEVDAALAGAAGRHGSLVIASQPRVGGSGHLAPVVDATWIRDGANRSDYSVIPTVNNVGSSMGRMTVGEAFGLQFDPKYYLWIPATR